jgi:hypothetical protein
MARTEAKFQKRWLFCEMGQYEMNRSVGIGVAHLGDQDNLHIRILLLEKVMRDVQTSI